MALSAEGIIALIALLVMCVPAITYLIRKARQRRARRRGQGEEIAFNAPHSMVLTMKSF